MYNINRQQASEILGVSTRSIDRYIKSGKIRAKKDGKNILLNDEDIKNLGGKNTTKHKIIIKDEKKIETEIVNNKNPNQGIVKKAEYEKILATFDKMFTGFREEIKEKDKKIQELSLELGKAQEQKKNTVDIMEYKKVQFLSEEAKKGLSNSLQREKEEKEKLDKQLQYEKTTNKLLIFFLIILFIVAIAIFVIKI